MTFDVMHTQNYINWHYLIVKKYIFASFWVFSERMRNCTQQYLRNFRFLSSQNKHVIQLQLLGAHLTEVMKFKNHLTQSFITMCRVKPGVYYGWEMSLFDATPSSSRTSWYCDVLSQCAVWSQVCTTGEMRRCLTRRPPPPGRPDTATSTAPVPCRISVGKPTHTYC